MSIPIEDQLFNEQLQDMIINGGVVPCNQLHSGPCLLDAFKRFLIICNNSYKYYIPIYLIPFLLFQRKQLRKNPRSALIKLFKEFAGSICFVGGYIACCKYIFCKLRGIQCDNRISLSVAGFFSSIFLMSEKLSRRAEIVLFISPKVLETIWSMLAKRQLVNKIDYWEFLVFGLSMGIINYYYVNEPTKIKYSYLQVFKKLWN